MKEIAQHPENRFDTWIMKTWKILPTNPDFINLTEEQREWLWQDYLLDNPEIAKKIDQSNDTEFEEEWNSMDKDNPESTESDDKGYDIDLSDEFNKFVKDTNMEDIERSPESLAILEKINKSQDSALLNPSDWEEVDLDSEDWEEVDD